MINILNCIVNEPVELTIAPYKCLESYVLKDEKLSSSVNFHYLDCTGLDSLLPVNDVIAQYNISVCCFSVISSSLPLALHLAQAVKKNDPDVLTLLGGPVFGSKNYNRYLMETCPQIDVIVRGEGEITFKRILQSLFRNFTLQALEDIEGILLNRNGQIISKGDVIVITNLDELPFPYSEEDLRTHKKLLYSTKRGCAVKCKFCTWDYNSNNSRCVRALSLDRVKKDFLYFFENGIEELTISDSTFMSSREELLDMLYYISEKNTAASIYAPIDVKYLDEEVVGLMAGSRVVTDFYVQTLNCAASKIAGRSPYPYNKFCEVLSLFKKNKISEFNIELILGLPGDNYQSFKRTIVQTLDALIKARVFFGKLNIERLAVVPGSHFFEHYDEFGISFLGAPSFYVVENNTFSRDDIQKALELRAVITLSFNHPREKIRFIRAFWKYRSVEYVIDRFWRWLKKRNIDLSKVLHHEFIVPETFAFSKNHYDYITELAADEYNAFYKYMNII